MLGRFKDGRRRVKSTSPSPPLGTESTSWAMQTSTSSNSKPPMSRTMTIASTSMREQYWAGRALTAENLLASRRIGYVEPPVSSPKWFWNRNSAQLQTVAGNPGQQPMPHGQIHQRLEVMVMVLIFLVITLIVLVGVLLWSLGGSSARPNGKVSHFTIPILSPFASVVENEVSFIGTKILTLIVICFACVAYLLLRNKAHWPMREMAR